MFSVRERKEHKGRYVLFRKSPYTFGICMLTSDNVNNNYDKSVYRTKMLPISENWPGQAFLSSRAEIPGTAGNRSFPTRNSIFVLYTDDK